VQAVRSRGVFIAEGYGEKPWDLKPDLRHDVYRIYEDSKECLWTELDEPFVAQIPDVVRCNTQSANRNDYILHPATGERLNASSLATIRNLRNEANGRFDVQIVISDGLNALSIMDPGQLLPYLARLRSALRYAGFHSATTNLTFSSGRVRAGYRVGEALFGGLAGTRSIVHVIGERPGTGHHTFSAYLTAANGVDWATAGKIDHDITKVVSGIAITALQPLAAADETARLLRQIADRAR